MIVSFAPAPCVRDIGRGLRELVVTDRTGTRLWSSLDCGVSSADTHPDVQVLRPMTPVVFTLTWAGRTSHPHCSGPRTVIGPGEYQVGARLGSKTGGGARFSLLP